MTSAGIFAGQLLAALLNVQFSTDFARLAYLRFALSTNCSGKLCASLRGKTIFEVIYLANQVIADQPTITSWYNYTPSCLSSALTLFNEAFDKCQTVYDGECFECSPFVHENSSNNGSEAVIQTSWLSDSLLFFVIFIVVILSAIFVSVRARRSQSRYSRI
jgi:hypothetical protein